MERERSRKSRSSALNPRTAYFKILMRKGKVQVFHIRRIMLILENLKFNGLAKSYSLSQTYLDYTVVVFD
ncbi:hypothetical protein, partial [Acinetobacter sp. TR3]|uniref:hypothetical protein n=1 Tax=Acinetobacter sp. TR3 TaxID=3003392 RepID=UPI0022AC2E1B